MKRILAVILALATVICLFAACGKKDDETKQNTEPAQTEAADEYEYVELEDGSIKITKYTGEGGDQIEIPAAVDDKAVTVIGEGAFENCASIKYVKMPGTLVAIEKRAFAGSSITNAMLESGNDLETIGEEAFKDCKSLVQVDIRKADTIGKNAFAGCAAFAFFTIRTDMELNKDMFGDAKKCKFIVHEDEAKIQAYAEKNGHEVQIF